MTSSLSVAPIQLTPNELLFYRENGYLMLPGLVSRAAATAMGEEVFEIMASAGRTHEQLRASSGASGKLAQSPQYLEGGALDAYINAPELRALAAQLMEGPASLYMPFSAVKSGGGGGTFHFHQDNQYTQFDGPGLNLWMALSPMSPENGCLMVAPGSHGAGTLEAHSPDGDGHKAVAVDPTRFLPLRMNPGDVVAFSRLTVHGSGPNATNEARLAYAVQFHRDDVKAVWDEQPPRLLKTHPRWDTAPVRELTRPNSAGRDGH